MKKDLKFYGNQIFKIAKKMDLIDVMEFESKYSKQERLHFPTLLNLFHLIRNMEHYQQLLIVEFWIESSCNIDILTSYMQVLYETLLNYLRLVNKVRYLSILLTERIYEMKFLRKIKAYDVFSEEWNQAMKIAQRYKITNIIDELDKLRPQLPIQIYRNNHSGLLNKRVI